MRAMAQLKQAAFALILTSTAAMFGGFAQEHGDGAGDGAAVDRGAEAAEGEVVEADLHRLYQQLVEMKKKVEAAANEQKALKDKQDHEYRALVDDLRLERKTKARLKTDVESLDPQIAEQKEEVAEKKARKAELKPAALKQLRDLQVYVRKALPFKVEGKDGRLSQLEDIRKQIAAGEEQAAAGRKIEVGSGALSAEKALSSLWTVVEDEFRLTHENGMYSQKIMLDGKPVLADVVKLGMVMMYFRTNAGQFGMVVPRGNGEWEYKVVMDGKRMDQIEYLFDSVKKSVRTGYFVLPNPRSEEASK